MALQMHCNSRYSASAHAMQMNCIARALHPREFQFFSVMAERGDDLPNFQLHFPFFEQESCPTPKKRFVEVTEEERDRLLEERGSQNTKYNTKWVVSLFEGKQ